MQYINHNERYAYAPQHLDYVTFLDGNLGVHYRARGGTESDIVDKAHELDVEDVALSDPAD